MTKLFQGLMSLVHLWIKYFGRKDIGIKAGTFIFGSGCTLMPGNILSLAFEPDTKWIPNFVFEYGKNVSILIPILIMALGIGIVIWRIRISEKKLATSLVYVEAIRGMKEVGPKDFLPGAYTMGIVDPITVSFKVTEEPSVKLSKVKTIDDQIKGRILSLGQQPKHVVFAGLADVPLLYAAGVSLGPRADVACMDYDRTKKEWHMLDALDSGERVTLVEPETLEADLALILPFTVPVHNTQLPDHLQGSVARFEPEWKIKQDAIVSAQQLDAVLETIHSYVRNVSSQIERLHIFMGVGASTAFKFGTLFQPNIYQETYVYQYDAGAKGYPWSLKVDKKNAMSIAETNTE